MRITTGMRLVVLAITLFAHEVFAKPTAPVELLINGISNPLAIDRDATRFTWMLVDTGRGERQTAYQILVASSPEQLAKDKADRWDS